MSRWARAGVWALLLALASGCSTADPDWRPEARQRANDRAEQVIRTTRSTEDQEAVAWERGRRAQLTPRLDVLAATIENEPGVDLVDVVDDGYRIAVEVQFDHPVGVGQYETIDVSLCVDIVLGEDAQYTASPAGCDAPS